MNIEKRVEPTFLLSVWNLLSTSQVINTSWYQKFSEKLHFIYNLLYYNGEIAKNENSRNAWNSCHDNILIEITFYEIITNSKTDKRGYFLWFFPFDSSY